MDGFLVKFFLKPETFEEIWETLFLYKIYSAIILTLIPLLISNFRNQNAQLDTYSRITVIKILVINIPISITFMISTFIPLNWLLGDAFNYKVSFPVVIIYTFFILFYPPIFFYLTLNYKYIRFTLIIAVTFVMLAAFPAFKYIIPGSDLVRFLGVQVFILVMLSLVYVYLRKNKKVLYEN